MKKLFGIALVLAVLTSLCFGTGIALAADPPDVVNVTWSGTGTVGTTVTAGNDATIQFGTSGAGISGSFTATDSNDNPYGYNVDSVSSYIQSSVTNGSTFFQVVRTDSYSSYGHAGQVDYAYIGSSGTGEMATGSWTNYARMVNCTYAQPQTSGGYNFQASGSSYQIQQFIAANASNVGGVWTLSDNYAAFTATGNGTAGIDCMTTEASGEVGRSTRLGWGGGCYTDADAVFTGSGAFSVSAAGCNQIATPIADQYGTLAPGGWVIPGNGTYGSCSYNVIANFTGNFSVGNFSVDVK